MYSPQVGGRSAFVAAAAPAGRLAVRACVAAEHLSAKEDAALVSAESLRRSHGSQARIPRAGSSAVSAGGSEAAGDFGAIGVVARRAVRAEAVALEAPGCCPRGLACRNRAPKLSLVQDSSSIEVAARGAFRSFMSFMGSAKAS
jgi:hypothetical protein